MIIRDSQKSLDSGLETFQFADLQQKAEAYLNQVRQQAKEIQDKTQAQLEQWRGAALAEIQQETQRLQEQRQQAFEKARQEGYEKGFDQGLQEAQNDIQQTIRAHLDERLEKAFPALDRILDQLESVQKQWVAQWQRQGLKLSLAIAEKIVRHEIKQDSSALLSAVSEALELTVRGQNIEIHLSEDDYQTILPELEVLLQRFQRISSTEIISDPTLQPGDGLVQTNQGTIDLRLDSQLKRIEQELT